MSFRYQLSLGLGRRVPWTNYLQNSNMPRLSGAWTSDVAEEEQAQMTAKPVGTVQHCSPISPNPDMPSNAFVKLENNEGTMSQELEELTSSSAGTGLETPGQQGLPNEGTLEQRQTTANDFLTAGVGSSKERNIATSTTTVSGISAIAATPPKRRHKTSSEENKQFDPGGRGEKAPP